MLRSTARPICGRLIRLLCTAPPPAAEEIHQQNGAAPSSAEQLQHENGPAAAEEQVYDVVVSGGGMVGLAAAAAIQTHPVLRELRTTLLEAGPSPTALPLPAEFANRVCALSPATRVLFEQVDAWSRLERFNTVQHMQVWDSCSDAVIRFENVQQLEDLAYIVENDAICSALRAALAAAGGEVQYGAAVREIRLPADNAAPADDAVSIQLADGRRIRCSLLVGADGANSAVRAAMGVSTAGWKYGQRGVVATLKLATEADTATANTVAWQRFLSTGPVALLPLSATRSSLVWSTSDEQAARLLALSDEDFTDALNQALWEERPVVPAVQWATDSARALLTALGARSPSGPVQLPPAVCGVVAGSRAAFPLQLQQSAHYTRRRAVLLGDAARRCHPMAGQGANVGFGDVAELTARLAAAAAAGRDLGGAGALAGYETARQRAAAAVLALTDGLNRLYGTEAAPVVLLRSVGLQVCDALPPVRRFLMDRARA